MNRDEELAAALTAQHAAESLCHEWERDALHSLAGLVATPAEGYGATGTGPGQFKDDARRLRIMVEELRQDNEIKGRKLLAAAERIESQSAALSQRAEKGMALGDEEYGRAWAAMMGKVLATGTLLNHPADCPCWDWWAAKLPKELGWREYELHGLFTDEGKAYAALGRAVRAVRSAIPGLPGETTTTASGPLPAPVFDQLGNRIR